MRARLSLGPGAVHPCLSPQPNSKGRQHAPAGGSENACQLTVRASCAACACRRGKRSCLSGYPSSLPWKGRSRRCCAPSWGQEKIRHTHARHCSFRRRDRRMITRIAAGGALRSARRPACRESRHTSWGKPARFCTSGKHVGLSRAWPHNRHDEMVVSHGRSCTIFTVSTLPVITLRSKPRPRIALFPAQN